ncbi:ABC transporter permease [Chthonobacter rhizosphaerae]|uniref:ABC transporter permease n=1 Tax=Chthonobacter rhizosphaerae TaxID=2735553 RepID=UPI0015EFCA2B|nr:ABC transporter permease [Chthonobacter rhizosphaerae]
MTTATLMIEAAPPPPSVRRRHGAARVAGVALLALWTVLGVGIVWLLVSGWDAEMVERYMPRILEGVLTTLKLVGLSLVIGAVLSIPVAIGRLSRNPIAAPIAFGYSYFFRGTPLLAQTFLVYYGAGQFVGFFRDIGLWWFFRDAFNCAVLTFALNTAAYQAEILSGAIRSVPRGQWQAAQALGVSRMVTLTRIIVPQALITALRPYGNEVVLMIKGSAIASIITVLDLMGQTRYAFSKTYDMQVYLWAAILYLVMVEILRRVWDVLERRLTRHLRRAD